MALSQREQDIQLMLAASVHLGTKQCDFQMERYIYRRRQDGIYVINLGKTWDKLQLAARVIVAIENPQDVVVQSARPYAQRAVLKFAQYTGAKALAGRYTPGVPSCKWGVLQITCGLTYTTSGVQACHYNARLSIFFRALQLATWDWMIRAEGPGRGLQASFLTIPTAHISVCSVTQAPSPTRFRRTLRSHGC